MRRKHILLPLLAMLLSACTGSGMSVSEAYNIGNALGEGVTHTESVTIDGLVVSTPIVVDDVAKNFYIADSTESTNKIFIKESVLGEKVTAIGKSDNIVISGGLKKESGEVKLIAFNGSPVTITSVKTNSFATISVDPTSSEHAEVILGKTEVKVGTEYSFVVRAKAGYIIDKVLVNGAVTAPIKGTTYKITITGNTVIKASAKSESGDIPIVGNEDGLTIDTAFSAATAVAMMKEAGANVVVNNTLYYVKGTFDQGTTCNSQYHEFYGYAGELYVGAKNESGVTVAEKDGALDGANFVVHGYMEFFNDKPQITFMGAQYSPTGEKFTPSLVKLTNVKEDTGGGDDSGGGDIPVGPTGEGICGANASSSGTVPSGAKTIVFDFTTGTSCGIPASSSGSTGNDGLVNGYQFSYVNASSHDAAQVATTGYLVLYSKKKSAASSISNITAIPGSIKKIDILMPVEAQQGSVSKNAPFVVDFGNTQLSTTAKTEGQTGGSGVTLSCFVNSSYDASFFSISVVQGKTSNGNPAWYNGMIAKITVTYVD